jgi:hypothetical protein
MWWSPITWCGTTQQWHTKLTHWKSSFRGRRAKYTYCDEGGDNFDVINYVVVVDLEGNEGYHRCVVVVIFFVVEED